MNRSQISWLFFGLSGRIGRRPYFLSGLLLFLLVAFPIYRFQMAPENSSEGQLWATLFWAFYFLSFWSHIALGVKRLHDFGKPGILAALIPLVLGIAFIVLSIYPGDKGANKYGVQSNAPA